jgi:hypothetical protein
MAVELKPNAFIGRAAPPADDQLSAALGPTRPLWDQVLAALKDQFGLTDWEWMSYSVKTGWSVRVKKAKRNILYMAPLKGCFRVAFIIGGKAAQAAHDEHAPARVLKLIDEGERYPEGIGIRFEVKSPKDLPAIHTLTALKLAH